MPNVTARLTKHQLNGDSDDHFPGLITEYRFRPAHHHEPFAIEVDYMTLNEIKELIEELLRTFRDVYGSDSKGVDSSERCDELKERFMKPRNAFSRHILYSSN